jgi:ABC-type transporter Mla subunit MlaD
VWPIQNNGSREILAAVSSLSQSVSSGFAQLNRRLDAIQVSQADITADVTAIAGVLTSVQATLGDVATQAGNLVTAVGEITPGQPIDTSALDALVQTANALQAQATAAQGALDPAVASVGALVPTTPSAPTSGSRKN